MKRALAIGMALFLGSLGYAQVAAPAMPAATALAPNQKVVELTKDQALQIMNLQFSLILLQMNLENATAKRQEVTAKIEDKYKISFKDYSFDINTGNFIPRPKAEKAAVPTKPEEGKTTAELKPVAASAEDALQIMNMEYAISGMQSQGQQLFNKRQELIGKLETEYKISMNDYDLDVVNGRFVEKVKTPDAAKTPAPAPAPAKAVEPINKK